MQVWQKPLSDGFIAVDLLNVGDQPAKMHVSLEEIGFKMGAKSSIRDLWERKDLEPIKDVNSTEVESHGVVVIKIRGKKSMESVLKIDISSIIINKGNHLPLNVTVAPSNFAYTLTSSNEDILSVTLAGVNQYRLAAKKAGECTVNAVTLDGKKSATCKITVISSSIPSEWNFDEIDDDKASASYEDSIFTIEAGGKDIWAARDQFAYLNNGIIDDSYISARVLSMTNPDPWAKTGLMYRETTDADSKFVMLCITTSNGISLQWRSEKGASCRKKDFRGSDTPVFLKRMKNENTFIAFKSIEGVNWEKLRETDFDNTFK